MAESGVEAVAMADRHDLARFVDAQRPVYAQVVAELLVGRKQSHWMWFVFPQLRGLGTSPMAHRFGIASRAEAEAYWQHPVLGPRLADCVGHVLAVRSRSAHGIFGSPDDMKFRSSMTLFNAAVPGERLFADALAQYFDGQADARTLERLGTG